MVSAKNCTVAVGFGSAKLTYRSAKKADIASTIRWISLIWSGLIYLALFGFSQPARAEEPKLIGENYSSVRGAPFPTKVAELARSHQLSDGALSALVDFVQSIDAAQPKLVGFKETENPHPQFDQAAFAALREFAQQIGADKPGSVRTPQLKVAEADNAFDALREFLQKGGAKPNSTPSAPPSDLRRTAPSRDRDVIAATFVGGKTCLTCHASQAEAFGKTLMGKIGKTQPGKFDCENCHGPGSAHVQAAGCAGCHGEVGISKRPGMPSLVGLDPQYLVSAMKAYKSGQRKHEVMRVMLSSVGEAELNNIALYYARQIPARAQTPAVGDPAAGKTASASCAGCHGEQGVSANPAWPSLAGQDAQYLAVALKAYKDGSRNDATMKALVAALDARTINNIASYYASLRPAQPSPTNGARNAPARHDPILVSIAAPSGGRSPGGIISFRPNDPGRTAEENNAVCLTCHQKGERTNWHGSTHDERGLQCSNCHTVMKNVSRKAQLKTEFQPDTCFQCHKNKRAEMFRTSHIPVREGKVVCTNCHNPHGSYSEALLKTATVNEVCWQCHAEKRGPFLWEHPPVAESCLNCHDPHGSNNDFLLKISRPRLCQQCHSGGQHNSNPRNPLNTLYAQGRECQNCHSNHHGSNNPAGPRFMR
jgi:DmsE family decaheme c-type cytochrome